MTGYARDAIVHDGMLDPRVQLLAKPFTPETLVRKLRETIDKWRDQDLSRGPDANAPGAPRSARPRNRLTAFRGIGALRLARPKGLEPLAF